MFKWLFKQKKDANSDVELTIKEKIKQIKDIRYSIFECFEMVDYDKDESIPIIDISDLTWKLDKDNNLTFDKHIDSWMKINWEFKGSSSDLFLIFCLKNGYGESCWFLLDKNKNKIKT